MVRYSIVLFGLMALVPVQGARLFAADWPEWRGPHRDGVVEGVKLPGSLPEKLKQIWSIEVGAGYSAPVVVGGMMVVLSREGEEEVVRGLNAVDGKVIWRDSYPAPYKPEQVAAKHGKGPFATPTIAGGRVYTCGISNIISCYDLTTGKRIWRKHFREGFKKPHPTWGTSNSPLIEEGMCILGIGTERNGGLAALNINTGELIWKLTVDGPGYASPLAVDLAGERQIIMLMQASLVGAEANTGKLLWKVPFKVPYEQNALTPVIKNPLIFTSGYRMPGTAVRISKEGGEIQAKTVWTNEQAPMFMCTPVVSGNHLYGLSQNMRGCLVCLSLDDGQIKWTSPGRWGEYASIVRAGDKLLILNTTGELILIAADPSVFKELGRTKISDRPVWSHLGITENRIFVKDSSHLTCFELLNISP